MPWNAPVTLRTLVALALAGCGDDLTSTTADHTAASGISLGDDGSSTGQGDEGSPTSSGGATAWSGGVTGDETDDDGGPVVDEEPHKWDIPPPEGGSPCGDGAGGSLPGGSYYWRLDSDEFTVSKVNTATLAVEATYRTGAQPFDVTVNIAGDAAIRVGPRTILQIHGLFSDCVERNGVPGIQTSTGPDDVYPVGEDECVGWQISTQLHLEVPTWTPGHWNPVTCAYDHLDLWAVEDENYTDDRAEVVVFDGKTGLEEDRVLVTGLASGWGVWVQNLQDGAADGDGNYWVHQHDGKLVRVDRDTLDFQLWTTPYDYTPHVTVDHDGFVWLCDGSATRFDPATATWTTSPGHPPIVGGSHCVVSTDGLLYTGGSDKEVVVLDAETLAPVRTIPVGVVPMGVTLDVFGYLWFRDFYTGQVYRLDLETDAVESVPGVDEYGSTFERDPTGYKLLHARTRP